jgi:hypothetical protein
MSTNAGDVSQITKQSQHPWMTSYKVNFKRFVKKVLERDLVELSKMNETNEAILRPFVNQHSI